MTVASYQLIRADGVAIPAFRTNPSNRDAAVRAALAVMVSEADKPWAHRLLFVMADGSRVVARAKPFNPEHGA